MTDAPTFALLIAQNVKRLRGHHTMDEVASVARELGMKWTSGNIATIEAGKVRPTLQNLMVLTYTFGKLHDRPMRPSELFAGTSFIESGVGDWRTTADGLDDWWATGRDPLLPSADGLTESMMRYVERDMPEGITIGDFKGAEQRVTSRDVRLARSLDIAPRAFRMWSEQLWGRGFEDERDDRAGAGATAQKKGRVARVLKDELRAKINEQGSDDDPR